MLAAQRQALILEEVNRLGAVRVIDLAQSLRVSDMTVRRDLDVLADAGLLTKVHGGATALEGLTSSSLEPTFSTKVTRERAAKEAIATQAAKLVEPGAAIAISGGTTTHAFARMLVDVPGLTVVTNSLPLADLLHTEGRDDQTVILTGGMRTPSDALVGPVAVEAIRRLHVDRVFMGTYGMDERAGFTSPNLLESETNRALVDAGRRLVVLADHTKWGLVGLSAIARLEEADLLITDNALAEDARALLSDRIAEVVTVDIGTTQRETA
jgi:DeoR/GlpR family transcriptional regulator of sugar metabolism